MAGINRTLRSDEKVKTNTYGPLAGSLFHLQPGAQQLRTLPPVLGSARVGVSGSALQFAYRYGGAA